MVVSRKPTQDVGHVWDNIAYTNKCNAQTRVVAYSLLRAKYKALWTINPCEKEVFVITEIIAYTLKWYICIQTD